MRRRGIKDQTARGKISGAHLAAKLDCFSTDERTLTDELCDMLCIWLVIQVMTGRHATSSLFDLSLAKTTTAEETEHGADLELIVASPLGRKRCLIQAKVLDPERQRLRCDSTEGWEKLRSQLVNCRDEAGDLAYLLVYIPGRLLDRQEFGFGTYEQGFLNSTPLSKAPHNKESYFGATIIPVSELIRPSGQWRSTKYKVKRDKNGSFKGGIPFWRFLLELLLCRQGQWDNGNAPFNEVGLPPFRRFVMTASGISVTEWREMQELADEWLAESNTRRE